MSAGFDARLARTDFENAAGMLTRELRTWRLELGRDIARAKQRGFLEHAADLHGLLMRVEQVLALGEALRP